MVVLSLVKLFLVGQIGKFSAKSLVANPLVESGLQIATMSCIGMVLKKRISFI